MNRRWKRLLCPTFFSLVILVLLGVNYFSAFGDLDYTWQIRTGEKILATGDLVPSDSFTYTIAGQRVPEFEGPYEVGLALIWRTFGYGGLKFLKTVLVALPLFLLGLRLRQLAVPWHHVFAAVGVAIFVLIPCWNLRPYYFTTLGLIITTWMLQDHCFQRRPLPWFFPLVLCTWANLHPGVITGQGLICGAIGWEWCNRLLRWNTPLDKSQCWRLTLIGGLALAATFFSPHPVERFLYPFSADVKHSVQKLFVEMQPAYLHLTDPNHLSLWLIYAITAAVAYSVVIRFRDYRMWELALLLGVTGLANLALRSLQDWTYITLLVGVPRLSALVRESQGSRNAVLGLLHRLDRSLKGIVASRWFRPNFVWPAVGFGLLLFLSVVPVLSKQMPVQDGKQWPSAALDWCQEHDLHGNFFASPDFGSFIEWKLGDKARAYTDTRGFFFSGMLLEDSLLTPQLCPDWRERLNRILDKGTDYFLLETEGARGQLWQHLRPNIPDPLYLDSQAVVLSATQVRKALAMLSGSRNT
ncbi:hypothetical protein BH10PLA2_BH10PLA2_22600 [soil metagenome]